MQWPGLKRERMFRSAVVLWNAVLDWGAVA